MVRKTTAAFVVILTGTAMAGCSSFQPVTSGTTAPCVTLQNIVADYPNDFSHFRGSSSNFSSVTIYRAKEQLIKGYCEIWAWGNGDSAYTCSISAPDKNVARNLQAIATSQLAECLGPDWQTAKSVRERDNKPAGERIDFATERAELPSISLHRVENLRRHSVYLFIGSSNREPR